jgi:serine/threonine-protein kinase RsbW
MARRLLLGAMETAGVDPEIAAEIGLALTEACANVVEHAESCDPHAEYRVWAGIIGDRCRIEVSDGGPGFAADRLSRPVRGNRALSAEGGRGLQLIQAMSDKLQLSNEPGNGAVLRFEKNLRWRKDPLVAS